MELETLADEIAEETIERSSRALVREMKFASWAVIGAALFVAFFTPHTAGWHWLWIYPLVSVLVTFVGMGLFKVNMYLAVEVINRLFREDMDRNGQEHIALKGKLIAGAWEVVRFLIYLAISYGAFVFLASLV